MQKTPFYKSLLNSAYLWSRAQLTLNKNKNISHCQATNLQKIWFLVLISMKGQKKDKREPITKFVEVIVTIIFI